MATGIAPAVWLAEEDRILWTAFEMLAERTGGGDDGS